jgi:group I intron endonuclease
MSISGIYKIQSALKPNKCYIGSAKDIFLRWRIHLNDLRLNKHHSSKLQNHFNKYGEGDLFFTVILGCDKEDLIKTEQYFIDSYKPFFNCSITAGSPLGVKHTDQAKKNMSNAHKGYVMPEEQKRKISQSLKGIKRSPEVLKKIADGNRGKKLSEEHRLKLSISHKGIQYKNRIGKHSSSGTEFKKGHSFLGKSSLN